MGLIQITRGKDVTATLRLTKGKNGPPQDLTGFTLIKLRFASSQGVVELLAPLTPAINEVQKLDFSAPADAGSFKIKIGSEKTASLGFDASNTDIQTAINNLKEISGAIVTGSPASSPAQTTFAGGSAGRDIPEMTIPSEDNSLTASSTAVSITPSTTTPGVAENGVDVINEPCGIIKMKMSEVQSLLFDEGKDQAMDPVVRIGTEDLNISPILAFFDVAENPVDP